jgi:adenylate cyclase class IV
LGSEVELKAVVADPTATREALRAAGAQRTFEGMLRDRRLDREANLAAGDRVLRLREWAPSAGVAQTVIGWKGPTRVSPGGYKQREEVECPVADAAAALALFQALGYDVVQTIDRYVEVYRLTDTVARFEWYPRLDVLVEIEGPPEGIERVIAAAGPPRRACVPDPLAAFAARYEARTGRTAVLSEAALEGDRPSWNAR